MPYRLAIPQKINGAGDKFRTCYLQSHNLALYQVSYARHMVRLERLEPPTHGLEGRCSILLSYRRKKDKCTPSLLSLVERVMGVEPTQPAWKASVLPVNYTRIDNTEAKQVPDNSMLVDYSKSIFLCQLILRQFFLNKYYFSICFALTKK